MQKTTPHDSSFPYSLVIVFFIVAAGSIVGGYFSYSNYTWHYRSEVEKQLAVITEMKTKDLVHWRRERLNDAQALYKNPLFSELLRGFFDNPQDSAAQKNLQHWLNSILSHIEYEHIFLLDTRGNIRLSAPEASPVNIPHLPGDAAKALSSGQILFLDLHRNTADGPPHMAMLVPLYDEQTDRRPLGIIALWINPEVHLYPLINRWPTSSRTAETLIVRRDGDDALFLNELKYRKDTALKLRIPLSSVTTPAVQAALGRTGCFEGLDYRGVPVIADVRAIPDSPWFIVARIDIEEVFAPLKERLWIIVLFISAMIFSTGLVLLVIWRQQRLRLYWEQVKHAVTLRESEHRLRAVLDSTPFPVALVDMKDTNIYFWSRSALDIFGHTAATTQEWYELAYPDPEYRREVISRWKPFLETARQTGRSVNTGEYRVTCSDGSERSCELYALFHVDSLIVTFNDITERKQAGQALALQARIDEIFLASTEEDMYNDVLNVVLDVMQSPFGVFGYLDTDGSLIVPTMTRQVWDQCQMPDKTIRFPREVWGDSSWPRSIREKKLNYTNEPSTRTPEGHVVLDRHISLPIMLGGNVIGLFQVANKETDYTEADVRMLQSIADHVAPILSARLARERYEKELLKTNAELTRFTYTMSHDLKSPLVTVKTFLGYLEKDIRKQDAGRIENDFTFIRGAADKMGRLLDELLDLTRIGRVMNPDIEAPLQDIVQEALVLVAGRIAERGVQVKITQQPLLLRGDRPRLVELFQNLIDNAVKFMGDQKDPKVEIGMALKNGEKFLFVRDNGMGIDPRHKGKLFGLFEKLHPEIEGTGMGLALVKRIVEVHGGRIWAESEGPGKGACFWFSLPGK